MSISKLIGNNKKKIREKQEVKIEILAKHLRITKGRLSQIESGECSEITLNRLETISNYLNVTVFDIIGTQTKNVDINNSVNCSGFN